MGPNRIRTPAVELLTAELTVACLTPDGRLVASVPPQEGLKTSLLREMCIDLLTHNPNRRLLYASYSTTVAAMQGREIGNQIDARYGTDTWRIKQSGNLHCCGPGSAFGGRLFDTVVVDDPLRGIHSAGERQVREDLHAWWAESVMLKLAPSASVVLLCSRTHPDDLYGRLAAQRWPAVNIPALADGVTPDVLEREPGTWLESARGRTVEQWRELWTELPERDFQTAWQGCP